MKDFFFDIQTREFLLDANGIATTNNPSVQNGGIFLASSGANPQLPMLGIGLIPQVINGSESQLTYELNRWISQVKQDGATLATWTARKIPGGNDVVTKISYI